ILSKFYTVLSFSVLSTIFIFVVALILGLIYSDYNELSIIFSDLEFLVAFFVKLLGFFSFCLFLGILVKRSAFALGFLILWQIFPLSSMSNLITEPFSRLNAVQSVANQVGQGFEKDYAVHWYEILIVLIWTFLFIYGSYVLLRKRDL